MTSLLDKMGHVAQFFITFVIVNSFVSLFAVLIFVPTAIAPDRREILVLLVGVLTSTFKEICSYWFGSSLSSAKKQDQITRPTP